MRPPHRHIPAQARRRPALLAIVLAAGAAMAVGCSSGATVPDDSRNEARRQMVLGEVCFGDSMRRVRETIGRPDSRDVSGAGALGYETWWYGDVSVSFTSRGHVDDKTVAGDRDRTWAAGRGDWHAGDCVRYRGTGRPSPIPPHEAWEMDRQGPEPAPDGPAPTTPAAAAP